MLDGETDIAAALHEAGLGAVRVEPVHFGGPAVLAPSERSGADRAFVVECPPPEIDATWHAAAAAVDTTGRWPIATAGSAGEPLATALWGSIAPSDSLPEPLGDAELDRRIAALIEAHDSVFTVDDDDLSHELHGTATRSGTAPSVGDVHRALGASIGQIDLNSWLFRWEVERAFGEVGSSPDGHLAPYRPSGGPCGVVLLPTAEPWRAAAMLPFHGVDVHVDTEVFVSLLHRWHRRWGAEVIASYGTLLELQVHFPPSAPDDVLGAAIEHAVLANDTMQLPGVSLRDHARALVGRPAWHLHARP